MSAATAPQAAGAPVLRRVRLYLAGDAPNSVVALANLRAALAAQPHETVELEIIDVLTDPSRSLRDGVLMTPMLVRHEPLPERRVLGNLSNRALLLRALGFDEAPSG